MQCSVGGLGFECCVFVAGWWHALQSEWPNISIIFCMTHSRDDCPETAVSLLHQKRLGSGSEPTKENSEINESGEKKTITYRTAVSLFEHMQYMT